jgi:DNA-binding transcriptional LysR family regulator
MRWDDVQVFLRVAQTGSLSGAARALGVNHSTVFRRLGRFEEAMGVKLFDREGGRYTLTEAGRAARASAETAEMAIGQFSRTVAGHDQELAGRVRLTSPEALLPVLAPHLAPFRARYPDIDLEVCFTDRFLDLNRQEADVALRPTPRPDATVVGRKVCAIAWTAYRPAGSTQDLPWAGYADDLEGLGAARWQQEHHGDAPVALTVNSVPAMHGVVCAAGVRGMLPCFVGDPDPNVERIRPPVPEAASALWLLVHPDLRGAARVRAVLDHLWDAMRSAAPLFEGDAPHGFF